MTKAHLTVETNGEPIEADFDITTDDQIVTITITPADIQIHTKDEPKLLPNGKVQFRDSAGNVVAEQG